MAVSGFVTAVYNTGSGTTWTISNYTPFDGAGPLIEGGIMVWAVDTATTTGDVPTCTFGGEAFDYFGTVTLAASNNGYLFFLPNDRYPSSTPANIVVTFSASKTGAMYAMGIKADRRCQVNYVNLGVENTSTLSYLRSHPAQGLVTQCAPCFISGATSISDVYTNENCTVYELDIGGEIVVMYPVNFVTGAENSESVTARHSSNNNIVGISLSISEAWTKFQSFSGGRSYSLLKVSGANVSNLIGAVGANR